MPTNRDISARTVERLSLYRRLLLQRHESEGAIVFSHELAESAGVTAAQVRRDFMQLGCQGVPRNGYRIGDLLTGINALLDTPDGQRAALVGVGHLGAALLNHFSGRWRWLHIHAAFDTDHAKVGTVIRGCQCFPVTEMARLIEERRIEIGIITVPKDHAQQVADRLADAGVRGLLNFAPLRLRLPEHVYVENVDLTSAFEKVAYFARRQVSAKLINEARHEFRSVDDRMRVGQ